MGQYKSDLNIIEVSSFNRYALGVPTKVPWIWSFTPENIMVESLNVDTEKCHD